ncbi:DNA polymerase [Bacteroides sedimenti]
MRKLSIDIETYSEADLPNCGVYRYVEDPSFEILLFAYAFDDEPVEIVDLARGGVLPFKVKLALFDSNVLKTAFNANFEITCLNKYLLESTGFRLRESQWECTRVRSAVAGLPLSLEAAAKVLMLEEQKMREGKALIRYFSMPCKPTKANGYRSRNLPEHDLAKWEIFKTYCKQDVSTERAISNKLQNIEITPTEQALWELDQKIISRGIELDMELVQNAISLDTEIREDLLWKAEKLTGLDNPNSVSQLKSWLEGEGTEVPKSLSKDSVSELLGSGELSKEAEEMLRIRQELSKTSVKKYQAMARAVCTDGRVRGLLQFYGANRTGRWAGRLVQVQNLPRNKHPELDLARELVKDKDRVMLEMCFGNVPNILSELIRTAFVAKEGCTLLVADYSAIEARVIAWLADEQWVLDVFNSHGKIYEATAAQMFGVPIESVTKGSGLRDRGKVAQLACGYQGGVAALTAMDVAGKIPDEEKPGLVKNWRDANPNIVKLWGKIERAAVKAVKEKTVVTIAHGVKFIGQRNFLFVELPSGRRLAYPKARMVVNRFGREAIQYEGLIQVTNKWGKIDTYGGKLTENIVQAIARDCLAFALLNLENAGYRVCMHIHDEVVIENESADNLEDVCRIMALPIPWAEGLPLRADGFTTNFYKKD